MTNTLTGILLAAAAGLNAYIPLLGLALADRATASVDLNKPYDVLSSPVGIVVLLALLTVDLIADKLPRIEHLNDLISTALRPASGMLLVMAVTDGTGEVDEVVAMMIGLLVAAAVHAYKAIKRVRIASRSSGIGNPLLSLAEDFLSSIVTLLALALPWVGAVALLVSGFTLSWLYRVMPGSFAGSRAGQTSAVNSAGGNERA